MPGRGRLGFETYTATERERRIVEINSHVCTLREILIGFGVTESHVFAYRVRLEAGPRVSYGSWARTESTYWALVFEIVPSGDDIAQCDTTVMLSDARKRIKLELQR